MPDLILKGVSTLSIGVATALGAYPATTTAIKTYKDSITLNNESANITKEYSDQVDAPIAVFSEKGDLKLKFKTFDYTPSTLLLFKGGTVLNDTYTPSGKYAAPVYVFVEMVYGGVWIFRKCLCLANYDTNIKRNGIALLDIELIPEPVDQYKNYEFTAP